MSLPFEGKAVIVTGAAQPIGQALARHFAARGASVMFADSDEGLLDHEMRDLPADEPRLRRFAADLGEKLALANLVSATVDAFDRIDILVNAHRAVRAADPLDTDPEVLDEMLRHNLSVALRLSQMAARRMIRQAAETEGEVTEAGAIVNVSTLAGVRPIPQMLGYSIACAALDQCTRGLALALAPHRIRVNGVSYSSMMTNELRAAMREDYALRERVLKGTPLGRIAAPDDLVETAALLASPGAGFVTGQILTIDGGRSLADPVTAQMLQPSSG